MKSKLTTIAIVSATLILAGVAIFTSIRLYQLRKQSVVPTQPESQPEAYSLASAVYTCEQRGVEAFTITVSGSDTGNCPYINYDWCIAGRGQKNNVTEFGMSATITLQGSKPVKIKYRRAACYCPEAACGVKNNNLLGCWDNCYPPGFGEEETTLTPGQPFQVEPIRRQTDSGQACGSFQLDVTVLEAEGCNRLKCTACDKAAVCQTGTICEASTPTPSPSITPSPSPTPTASPSTTPSPTPEIGGVCTALTFSLSSPTPSPTPTATPSVTPTPTPTPPAQCSQSCDSNNDCENNLICSNGMCRNASCTGETDCICPTATPSPSPTKTPTPKPVAAATPEPSLPQAGTITPTIFGVSIGIVLLLISAALAL